MDSDKHIINDWNALVAKTNELVAEVSRLKARISNAERMRDRYKLIVSMATRDLVWHSTKKSRPEENASVVYLTKSGYRIGVFNLESRSFVNEFSRKQTPLHLVLSWAYTEEDGFIAMPTTKKDKERVSAYREEHEKKKTDSIEKRLVCTSGYVYDGYCPCGNGMDLYLEADGKLWMNGDEVLCNILDYVHYKESDNG